MYEPDRVSTLTRSPMLTNSGTFTVAPVSRVAGLLPPPEGGVAADSRLGVRDLELHGGAELDVRRVAVDVQHVDAFVGLDHLQRLGHARLRQRDLLVGLLVHEVRVGAVGVEELHLARLGVDRAELLAGAEGTVDHIAVSRAAELGADEGAALAGLDVLELDDLEDGAFDLDVIAVLELVRGDHVR